MILSPEARVNQALAQLPYGVTKPLRDLIARLIRDAELDWAMDAFLDAVRIEALAASIVRRPGLPVLPLIKEIQS